MWILIYWLITSNGVALQQASFDDFKACATARQHFINQKTWNVGFYATCEKRNSL